MSEVSSVPEPDQYWEHVKSKDRVYFIGRNPEGVMVWQCEGDTVEIGNLDWSGWQHIPDCTGWDWEMEKQLHAEVFPQYWTSPFVGSKAAFVKRVSDTDCFAVMPNGKEGPLLSWHHSFPEKREQITEEQALGLLDKPYVGCAEIQNGPIVISNKQANEIQAILDKPAEAKARVKPAGEWPKYVVNPDESCKWYIKLISENSAQHVSSTGIESPERWGVLQTSLVKDGQWVEVTEAEAFARVVKPTEHDSDPPPFSKPFTSARSGMGIRKDLPPVPAPIEETFPQWYMLKESEVLQAFTPWAIKRTGEETSIRYAYDGGDKLLASNETWYGATDVWRQCHSAEAFQRLGILGEAYLPAVPADKRRVPIKAWVTYRLADEGGDWPVRATPADQTYLNWKEIKFDSNGMFIEVDQ